MEMKIGSNQDARDALSRLCQSMGVSMTKLTALANIGNASLTRFVYQKRKVSNGEYAKENSLNVLTFVKALDAAGYELIVRPKVAGSRRERRLAAIKQRSTNDEGTAA